MIIFARPRHDYQSYTDLWTIIRACEYPLIFIDEIDPQRTDCVYIYSTPDASHAWPDARARIIYWLLEWYGDYTQKAGVSETWVSNKTYAEKIGAHFVPLGSHPALGTLERYDAVYDVAHMSYADIHRRRLLLDELRKSGVRVAPNGWGIERDAILRHSRAMLHIHQHADFPGVAPLRAALAAAYGLPLIAENGWDMTPYQDTIYAAYDELAFITQQALKYADLEYYRIWIHQLMCDRYRFDRVVGANV